MRHHEKYTSEDEKQMYEWLTNTIIIDTKFLKKDVKN